MQDGLGLLGLGAGGAPPSTPPPPPPPPPGSIAAAVQAAAAAAAKAAAAVAGPGRPTDMPWAMHPQPPPPPSQAPQVLPARRPAVPQGPPPPSPPQMSPPLLPGARKSRDSRPLSEDARKKEEVLYLTTPEAEKAAREKYGLLGILEVIRMTDSDLNTLALGLDLTTLGLNLNSPDCLYGTFASPWSDAPARKDPEFNLPACYYMSPPQLKTSSLQRFALETLFYIFFNMPRDMLQAYAAAELYNRGWKYHRDLKNWLIFQEEDGQPRWVCFDSKSWDKQVYHQPLDLTNFLTEDEVRVRIHASTV